MELVIKIPDEVWYKAKEYGHLDICGIELSERVMNGVPLPKGHGDLIDRKELLKTPMNTANCPKNYVNIAHAIIEADKESEK